MAAVVWVKDGVAHRGRRRRSAPTRCWPWPAGCAEPMTDGRRGRHRGRRCSPRCRRPRRCGAPACASGTDGGPRSTTCPSPSSAARCSGCSGPNGAGKTSVIKMLLGLVRPDAGEVLLLGRPAKDPLARTGVGYLPELFRYQPWLTAAEVLDLHVRLAGVRVPRGGAARVPGPGRAGRPRRRPRRRVLQGHAAAARAGRRPGRPAGARRPRRADQRAGPARPGRRPRPACCRSRPAAWPCCSTRT